MNDEEKLVNAIMKDADRAVITSDLCKAVREAKSRRWRSCIWNRVVTEEQARLDALMREANLVKADAAGRVVNATM